MYFRTDYPSPIGLLTLAADGNALVGLWLENQKYFAAGFEKHLIPGDELPVFRDAKAWLDAYFAGLTPDIRNLPLAPEGSAFQHSVWEVLKEIPYGQTVTYGEIARALDCRSAQAVGGAVGRNPISIIIPCHRVLGAGGSLTGYAGGTERKLWLLRHEGIHTAGK